MGNITERIQESRRKRDGEKKDESLLTKQSFQHVSAEIDTLM